MTELISKWDVVNKLTALENEFQQFKPFEGFEHAMYRKLCELEMEIGKTPGIAHGVTVGDKQGSTADNLSANGVTVQEWISVKDRLPEKGEKVVACGAEGGLFIAKVNDCGGAPFVVDAERKFRRRATHWMPLPKPPKGE